MTTLEKYSFGIGDRFGHQGKAQLQAIIYAQEAEVQIVPVIGSTALSTLSPPASGPVLDLMTPGGGYIAGASRDTILEETPVENVLEMFDTIEQHGVY